MQGCHLQAEMNPTKEQVSAHLLTRPLLAPPPHRLQDSMGGNSNVLFIGCVTPSRFCDTGACKGGGEAGDLLMWRGGRWVGDMLVWRGEGEEAGG